MRKALLLTTLLLISCRGEVSSEDALPLATAHSFDFAQDVSDLPADPAVRFGKLENGLRYALMANDTPSDAASLLFYVDAGSLDETEETRGLAHFLEHMAFNGSDAYPEGELVKSLERLGLAFGADTNAYTTFDRTVYSLQLPNVREETVDAALGAMRETASRLTLDPAAIDSERGVIQAELRARKSPASRAAEASLDFLLEGTLYPQRLPIGTPETIDSVTAEQFRAFYDGRYRPETSAIVMVGDFDVDAMEARIRERFGDWRPDGEALPIERPASVPERGPREGVFIDPEVSTAVDAVTFRPFEKPLDTAAARRERNLDGIGNALLNRRFQRLATEGTRDFLGASAASYPVFDIVEISTLTASSEADRWDAALADAVVELNKAREFCFTQAELDEYLANARRTLQRQVDTADTRRTPGLANQLLGSVSNGTVFTTPASSLERYLAFEDTITLDEICPRFRSKWEGFGSADLFLRTSDATEPDELRTAFDAAMARPVEANADRAAAEFAYSEWGEPGRVAARGRVEDIDFQTVDFENGVRLNIKRTDYAKDQVIAQAVIGGGLLHTDWQEGFNQIAGGVLGEGGLGAHTVDELQTLLAGRTARSSIAVATETLRIGGGASGEDMPLMFDLMMANLTDKAYRDAPVQRFRRQLDAFYDQIDSTPGGVAARDVPRLLRSGDRRFGIPDKDVLEALDADDVRDVVEPLLSDGHIEIAVVGDVDPERVVAEVARTFGTLPARPVEVEPVPDAAAQVRFPDPGRVMLTHQGEPTTALLQVVYPAFDDEDIARVRRAQVARDIAQLKLTDVLREQEGQSYSPSIGAQFSPSFPGYGYVAVSVEADPDELDTIEGLIDAVAADMREGRITQDEFERAIRPTRESVVKSLESNGYWLGVLDSARAEPESLDAHRTRIAAYREMELADILPVARQVFVGDAAYRIRIVPEARVAAEVGEAAE